MHRKPDHLVTPQALKARERRAHARQLRLEAGWTDGRYRDPSKAPKPPYMAVQRWRLTHRDTARLSDRVYKGMKRNRLFLRAWPEILAHYGGRCLCCGSTDSIAPDHVLPVLDDPITHNVLANLQPLCRRCNSMKRSRPEDYRPDHGAWITATYGDEAAKTLHPTKRRARYGSNGWKLIISNTIDDVCHTASSADGDMPIAP